ncbi:MAG: hypothetical protein AAFZ07_13660, partial [Actinomycetota bacterium]
MDVVAARATTARVVELCDQLQGLQAELTGVLGEWLSTSWWSFDGARSPEEWLGLFGLQALQLVAQLDDSRGGGP